MDELKYHLRNDESSFSQSQSNGFNNDNPIEIVFAYKLLLQVFSSYRLGQIQEILFSLNQENSYVVIRILEIITYFLKADINNTISVAMQTSFCNFALMVSQSRERDV